MAGQVIVVDTSALFAIYAGEAEAPAMLDAIEASERAIVGAPTAFEFRLVAYRRYGTVGLTRVDRMLSGTAFEIVAWTPDLIAHATDALHRFGGRPARLNYGDCMAYALAKSLNAPLLFKGGEFAATDIRPALPQ